jgi:hypothetical protein
MANRKIIGSLFCLRTNRARNCNAIRTQIRTHVDCPFGGLGDIGWESRFKRKIKIIGKYELLENENSQSVQIGQVELVSCSSDYSTR